MKVNSRIQMDFGGLLLPTNLEGQKLDLHSYLRQLENWTNI